MSGDEVHAKVSKDQQLTPVGIMLTIIGLLFLDGALQYVFLVGGAVLCIAAFVLIMQGKEHMEAPSKKSS